MTFWLYMLQCVDDSYYVGHTNDLEKRISEHQAGELDGYTATRGRFDWCSPGICFARGGAGGGASN